ncbi:type VI secretion system tube protein Hcp [Massilia solisilvae]|uniref:Type VI secretion system tube protein Hcp n=1 Tax=Massilia solisilvae TaxID=1811225 RepID=A0ABT2BPA4_9BURK|nr:type VI secretion system tube protein Hcp [Massilia solisilvae]MCS0610352.1 type VI secretion system tube protein Hcp [Massilia solisilvae]
MAIDVYLQIEGIKGESQDDKHKDWIEASGVRWSIFQPRSASASTAGGHTAERVEMSDISFTKMADLSTPILAQYCAMGKTIPKAVFEFMRADGDGKPICYFRIELKNVIIASVAPSIEGGHILHESIGLKFAEVVYKYTQQKIGGGAGGNTAGGWNLAANKVAS